VNHKENLWFDVICDDFNQTPEIYWFWAWKLCFAGVHDVSDNSERETKRNKTFKLTSKALKIPTKLQIELTRKASVVQKWSYMNKTLLWMKTFDRLLKNSTISFTQTWSEWNRAQTALIRKAMELNLRRNNRQPHIQRRWCTCLREMSDQGALPVRIKWKSHSFILQILNIFSGRCSQKRRSATRTSLDSFPWHCLRPRTTYLTPMFTENEGQISTHQETWLRRNRWTLLRKQQQWEMEAIGAGNEGSVQYLHLYYATRILLHLLSFHWDELETGFGLLWLWVGHSCAGSVGSDSDLAVNAHHKLEVFR
jgi:hypothetical protein